MMVDFDGSGGAEELHYYGVLWDFCKLIKQYGVKKVFTDLDEMLGKRL